MKLKKVHSLFELQNLALSNPRYAKLAELGSKQLGGHSNWKLEEHLRWLHVNASETDSEDGVIDEVNFCIDLVD